jgi:hypothetical protein
MNADDRLPAELLWQDDGHVTDVVVDSLADGQEALVPRVARDHVDACDGCAGRLGEAVLLSLRVQEHMSAALLPVGGTVAAARTSWPMPVTAIAVALLAALIATLPDLLEAPARFAGAATTLLRVAPDLVRAMLTVARGLGQGAQLSFVSTAGVLVLLAVGTAVARFAPRQQPARGGVR